MGPLCLRPQSPAYLGLQRHGLMEARYLGVQACVQCHGCHSRTTGGVKRQSFCQCGVSYLSGSLILRHTYLEHFLCTQFGSVQSLSHVQLFATPWTAARQASLSITNSWSLLKLMSIESMMPSNLLILCCPLFLLPSVFPSIRVFLMSQFFSSRGQSIGVSASASVLPVNIQE